MKATGIVRRIDDLGRIVIPKEIRKTMRLREGDPLEIFTNRDGEVIFKKYSPVGELSQVAAGLCESVSKATGYTVAVTDRDAVIACAGSGKKEIMDKKVGGELEALIEARQCYFDRTRESSLYLNDSLEGRRILAAVPVIVLGDITGAVLIMGQQDEICTDTEEKLCRSVAGFLGKQIE